MMNMLPVWAPDAAIRKMILVDTVEGRRPIRESHCVTDGGPARRAASRRSSSGTVMPSSAARRTKPA